MLDLSLLKIGETAEIIDIDVTCDSRDRLIELGFTKGSKIKVLRKAFSGDPIQIIVRETRFGLRKADAKNIKITKL